MPHTYTSGMSSGGQCDTPNLQCNHVRLRERIYNKKHLVNTIEHNLNNMYNYIRKVFIKNMNSLFE